MDKPIIARREVTNHILHTFKLKADKRLGQNFLIDEEVVRRIVAAAELSEDDTVLEVGPGIGTLTQGLAQSGARVVAVELDKNEKALAAQKGVIRADADVDRGIARVFYENGVDDAKLQEAVEKEGFVVKNIETVV